MSTPSPDFIETFDSVLPAAACQAIVQRFERSGHARRGEAGSGLDLTLKNSWDIALDAHAAWAETRQQLNLAVFSALLHYLRRYPHTVLGPLRLQLPDAAGQPRTLDADSLRALPDEVLTQVATAAFRPGAINLQKYIADEGGYPYWHSEQYPKPDQGEALHRVLLWTLYLNDGFDGGETEFLYQGRRIQPRTGSLLIAPAGFTHTHRGNRPLGRHKYIATSWVLFRRAEAIYGR
ncbi:MAG: 2OG-Fe(II) oxygenase [Aquincola sp.]|nr:2OG-Fe(II) oxygenase [Aquincola sp.]|tara:strand:- start:88 stop:792 length:705 start_codon:yes stop_codon:yes gene_type:complete